MTDESGLASFQRRFRAIPERMREGFAPDLLRAGNTIADTIRMLTPEDSGDLVASIAVTPPGASTPPHSHPGGRMMVPELTVAVTVGNDEVRYPHLVEFGTVKAAPHPFFFPGFRLSKKRALGIVKRGVSKAVRKNT